MQGKSEQWERYLNILIDKYIKNQRDIEIDTQINVQREKYIDRQRERDRKKES